MAFDNIQWVVQQNLTSDSCFWQIKEACESLNIGFIGLEIIPFSDKLPHFSKEKRSITFCYEFIKLD